MNQDLYIYNTLSRSKEKFVPLLPGHVGIYVCGPTVYNHSHVGHAKSYVSFDVIVRFLRFLGYKVKYVQNITDVGHLTDDADSGEDKIEKQARLDKVDPMEIVEKYMRSYFEDMDRLGVVRPDISPRAAGHVIEQIEFIKKLIEKGFAYEVDGNVYFDVSRFREYGKLSGKKLEDLQSGVRIDVRSDKKNPVDFALWKRAEAGHIMKWPSPWGEGYPGWHIECSTMSMKYLGETFDIHGGGIENQFPHHECEIAQSEALTGKQFVRYWMHNNMVTVNGTKMSKSLGNFVTLKDAFRKYDPVVLRFFILQSHYRSPLDYSEEAIDSAAKGFERLRNTISELKKFVKNDKSAKEAWEESGYPENLPVDPVNLRKYYDQWLEAMLDDFNTPLAIGVIFELLREVNSIIHSSNGFSEENGAAVYYFLYRLLGDVLGIMPPTLPKTYLTISEPRKPDEVSVADNRIEKLTHLLKSLTSEGQISINNLIDVVIELLNSLSKGQIASDSLMDMLIELLKSLRSEARMRKDFELADRIRSGLKEIGVILEDTKDRTVHKIKV